MDVEVKDFLEVNFQPLRSLHVTLYCLQNNYNPIGIQMRDKFGTPCRAAWQLLRVSGLRGVEEVSTGLHSVGVEGGKP